jgi:hypothetical protein
MTKVSYYRNIKDATSTEQVEILALLTHIRAGRWQDQVLKYRTTKDPEAKNGLPNFTVSGVFKTRKAKNLVSHSGFIAMDFDDLSPAEMLPLKSDPYTFSCFTSVGGFGFCAIVKIKSDLHGESWNQLANYYRNQYRLFVDPSGKDVSRTRFVSYDPDIYIDERSKTFTAKKEKKKKINRDIATIDDVTRLISKIVDSGVDVTSDYSDWIGLGFFLYEKYGDGGLDYYHQLSQFHGNYEPKQVDRKWETFKRGSSTGSRWSVGSLFYLAKQEGVTIDRSRTKEIVSVMKVAKKSGVSIDLVSESLEIEGKKKLTKEEQSIWDEVDPDSKDGDESELLKAVTYLRFQKNIYIDEITKIPYVNEDKMNDYLLNSLVIELAEAGVKVNAMQVAAIVNSNKFPNKDPLRDYFQEVQCEGTDAIEQLIESLNAKDNDTASIFMKYWLMGCMNTLYEYPVPYCPVLIGDQGNGKTYWVRGVITAPLERYYAEKSLKDNNDDKIMMANCFLILNDEYEGMAKNDINIFKQILSAKKFNLRRAYGRYNDEFDRIANIICTSNESNVLFDYTGNRRIFPIEIAGKINFKLYDSVDKDRFWGQVYTMWVNKQWPVETTNEHMELLKGKFNDHYESDKYDLILEEMLIHGDFMTNAEIMMTMQTYIKQDVNTKKMGHAMKKLGFEKQSKRIEGRVQRGYAVALNPQRKLNLI